ncbi:hypothetical protein B0H14DRAFT_3435338 [Mycena olivaceomarginata]|nr:hypothetical protein B0H14DRAFT_3435338 [Mycena olivaceomarginata]
MYTEPLLLPSGVLIAKHRHPTQVLIHNAATTIGQFKLTTDNLESQMTTNDIGPFLLTKLLTPKILAARMEHYTPCVVYVSSLGHSMTAGVDFNTLSRPDATRYVCKLSAPSTHLLSSITHHHAQARDVRTPAYSSPPADKHLEQKHG